MGHEYDTFFGGATPNDQQWSLPSQSSPRPREIRRCVWSCTQQEEDEWADALLATSTASNTSYDHGRRGDDASTAEYDNISQRSGYPATIDNTEIPKTIHFIWLGSNSIPSFPFLGAKSSPRDAEDDVINAKDDNHKKHYSIDDTRIENYDGRNNNYQYWNECMYSWKEHHPSSRGWTIHLWTEEDIIDTNAASCEDAKNHHKDDENIDSKQCTAFELDLAEMKNAQGYQHAMQSENYGMASDILRLEILNKFGGVYVDIDYWCVDSLDAHSPNHGSVGSLTQFFCGASNTGCIELNNGLMSCRQGGHPILWQMMKSIHEYFKEDRLVSSEGPSCQQQQHDHIASLLSSFLDPTTANALKTTQSSKSDISSMEVIEHTGPGLLTRCVCRWLNNSAPGDDCKLDYDYSTNDIVNFDISQVIVFPSHVFHPFPNHLREILTFQAIQSQAEMESNCSVKCKLHLPSSSYCPLSMLKSFIHSDETKAIHLWGCSWQDI